MGELAGVRAGVAGYDLAFAGELPLVDDQAVEADGATGVDFVGADASLLLPKGAGMPRLPLTAHPEIRMIGTELSRCVTIEK